MITRLHIENFQSHADTEIELSPTVTVFTGESDQGKTSVLRAFKKVVRNTPVGDFFIRWGQKECRVTLTVNGVDVERKVGTKGSGINIYTVGGDAYNNFGVSVPEEVRIALGMADIQAFEKDKIDFNMHGQHDGEFLVGSSGVEALRGRIFARVTGSDKVNKAVADLNSAIRGNTKERDRLKLQQQELENQLTTLVYIVHLGERLSDAERVVTEAVAHTSNVEELNGLLSDLRQSSKQVKELKAYLAAHPPIDVENLDTQRLDTARGLMKDIRTSYAAVKALKPLEQYVVDFEFEELARLQERLVDSRKLDIEVRNVERKMRELSEGLVTTEKHLTKELEDFELLKVELGVCPTCDRPFDEPHDHA